MDRRSILGLAAGAFALPALHKADAQTFDRPVRFIVPFAPGEPPTSSQGSSPPT